MSETAPAPIGYILKMYPRFSETFVLSELLELERQGVELHIYSLKEPDDGIFHADVSRLRAPVTYLPESPLLAPRAYAAAHLRVFGWNRRHYLHLLRLTLWRAVKRRRSRAFKRFLQAGYIAPLVRREGIAHVHAHFASTAASVAFHLHELAGITYSLTAHAKDIYRDAVDADSLARKLGSARFAVTVSDYNRRYLAGLNGGGPLLRIYNGLDLQQFSPDRRVPERPPLVLAVGRLIEKKGFDDLIRACAVLRREGCEFRCRIVGKGPLRSILRDLIKDLGLEAHVELAGPMPREALLEEYRRASVLVAPCVVGSDGNRDGLPTVITEAMALGVPVVATDVTGIPELVEEGRTGFLVPQRDPRALAGAIRRVLDDPGGAELLARAGRERVEERFDLRTNVAELRALLERASVA
jgi:glycosyltransferase involved in cell wall biosynthesis